MSNKKKDTVINIKPYHCKMISNHDGTFILQFYSSFGDSSARKKVVNIHFERWWLKVLAKCLWNHIKHEEEIVGSMCNAMDKGDREPRTN